MTPPGLNPYVTGNSVGDSNAFCGRQDILNAVHQILQSHLDQAIILYGQRRIGKTSVLTRLKVTLSNDDYLPILFNLEGKANKSVEEILQYLANKISRKLEEDEPNIAKCDDFLNWLEKRIIPQRLTNKRLVLLLDECDALKDEQFFRHLQSSDGKFASCIKLVFALARPVNRLPQSQSDWFRAAGATKPISLLNNEDTQEIISLSEKNETLQWSNDARNKIWQLTNGHPYITQNLCSEVWRHIYGSRKRDSRDKSPLPVATHKPVEEVIHGILENIDPGLQSAWKLLSTEAQFLALALSGNDSSGKLILTEKKTARDELEEEDWINKETHSVKVELVRQWIAQKSYDGIQQEWKSLDDEDKEKFDDAKTRYRYKKWPEVIKLLEPIIENTPSHLTAREMLAEAFFNTDQFEEAKKHFEELYKRKPDDVRPWLINTLEKLASKTTDEDEKEKFYSQILRTDKEHPEAKSWLQEHWKRRGEEAYQQGNLETAKKYYQKAGQSDKVAEVERKIWERRGDEAYQQGKLEEAEEYYQKAGFNEKAIKIRDILEKQGDKFAKTGHLEKALALYQKAQVDKKITDIQNRISIAKQGDENFLKAKEAHHKGELSDAKGFYQNAKNFYQQAQLNSKVVVIQQLLNKIDLLETTMTAKDKLIELFTEITTDENNEIEAVFVTLTSGQDEDVILYRNNEGGSIDIDGYARLIEGFTALTSKLDDILDQKKTGVEKLAEASFRFKQGGTSITRLGEKSQVYLFFVTKGTNLAEMNVIRRQHLQEIKELLKEAKKIDVA